MAQFRRRKIHKVDLPPLNKEKKYNTELSEHIQQLISYYAEDMLDVESNIESLNRYAYNDNNNGYSAEWFYEYIKIDLDNIHDNFSNYKQIILDNLQ